MIRPTEPSSSRRPRASWVTALGVVLLGLFNSGCGNNIGRLWDPDVGGGGGGDGTGRVVVPAGGRVADGRPRVAEAFPESGGWPTTVPVVVVFNEAMDPSSLEPQGGGLPGVPTGSAGVFLRIEGTQQALPGSVDLLRGNTTAIVRPAAALDGTVTYEICVSPEARDVDGVRFGGSEPDVVGTFRADRADTVTDGRIVTTLPYDNEDAVLRGEDVWLVFDGPVDATTVTTSSFLVRDGAGNRIDGSLAVPLEVANVPDPRFVRLRPSAGLFGAARHEIVVDATIGFTGGGVLEFDGRTPYAVFDTVPHNAPTGVSIGGATAEYPDKVNAANLTSVTFDVEVDDSVPAGSEVRLRVYGLEPSTQATDDFEFEELSGTTASVGPTTVSIPVGSTFGTPGNLRFDEGQVRLRAEVIVGRDSSGFAAGDDAATAIDVTAPTLDELLPGVPGSSTDIATDLETVLLHGTADEPLGSVEVTAGGNTASLFASSDDGRFACEPLTIGRGSVPVPYTLAITDRAGNSSSAAISGNILPRGAFVGALAGSLTVEAYDATTLAPISGATVVIEPSVPTKPATSQRSMVTDASGRAAFSALAASDFTFTVVAAGYDLVSVVECGAAFASVAIEPTGSAQANASLDVTAAFAAGAGETVLLGTNTYADLGVEAVQSEAASALAPPTTSIRAGRPYLLTAFSGVFPPTQSPLFSNYACEMCGVDLNTATPPSFGPAAGSTVEKVVGLLPSALQTVEAGTPWNLDFAAATGLGALDGDPLVRVVGSLSGFSGTALYGVGRSSVVAGSEYTIRGGWALPVFLNLQAFSPTLWVSVQASDMVGAISRHRSIVSNAQFGAVLPLGVPPSIPVVTAPTGPSTGAPVIEYADAVDVAFLPGGQGVVTLRITDAAGRGWRVLRRDFDAAGGTESLQLPVLGSAVTGLVAGEWQVEVESEVFFSTTAAGWEFHPEERLRSQVTFARSAKQAFTVQ